MQGMAEATAAPTVKEVNGQTYTLYPLELRDFGYIERAAREEILCATRASMTAEMERREEMGEDPLSEAEKRIQWAVAYDTAAEVSVLNSKGRGYLVSILGTLRLMWLSMRKADKKMSYEKAQNLLPRDSNDLSTLAIEVMVISGFITRDQAENPEEIERLSAEATGEVGNAGADAGAMPSSANSSNRSQRPTDGRREI